MIVTTLSIQICEWAIQQTSTTTGISAIVSKELFTFHTIKFHTEISIPLIHSSYLTNFNLVSLVSCILITRRSGCTLHRSTLGTSYVGSKLLSSQGVRIDFELNQLTLTQGSKALSKDSSLVHENILWSIVRSNKTKALDGIEKLHSTSWQVQLRYFSCGLSDATLNDKTNN